MTPPTRSRTTSVLTTRRSIALDAGHVEALREELDRLRLEVEELRASRRRLVLAADADRRTIERELHEGVQQHLVALAVNLQLAEQTADAGASGVTPLFAELRRDVQQALDATAQLAQRIHPPLLEAGGLAAALRSAAGSAGVRAALEVTRAASYPPELASAVYWCCVEAFEHAGAGARATVTVRDENGAVAFEVATDNSRPAAGLEELRDRVEALGGRLTIRSEPAGGSRFAGSLPLPR